MTRTIKASEVKPGMEIQWTHAGITTQCIPSHVDTDSPRRGAYLRTSRGAEVRIPDGVEVTVLSEPAPAQPEEPTEFGARVVAGGRLFLRAPLYNGDSAPWLSDSGVGRWNNWPAILAMGPVTVIPDQGWTVPAEAHEVPERVEEWPEDDTALRKHKWRDRDGDTWTWIEAQAEWECRDHRDVRRVASSRPFSRFAPWTRDSDA